MHKIVFSLTAHEDIECLYDLIDNIKKCFIHYDIIILLSLTDNLYNIFTNKYDFVKIITCRPSNLKMWGTIHLFHQHMLNLKYIYENNIKYDFFWFVASNEMFIKIVPPNFIDEYGLKIISKKDPINDIDYDIYYNNFITNKEHHWMWVNPCKQDTHFTDYMYKNKFKLYSGQHEGFVLPYNLMLEVFDEYNKNKIYEESVFKDYVMEEIFMFTYIVNKYNTAGGYPKFFCFRYIYSLENKVTYEIIEEKLLNTHLSIKPVIRKYDDPLRIFIRNNVL